MKENENYLIQVKQSRSAVGNGAIQEICTDKKYYEDKYGEVFGLITISNNDYTPTAEVLAGHNKIKLIKRMHLETMLVANSITIQDVNKIQAQRMVRI
jgi:HJR/Mrr/RecB family endonuclease